MPGEVKKKRKETDILEYAKGGGTEHGIYTVTSVV